MITIIDLQAGNFISLENVIKKITSEVLLSEDYDQISKSKIILLPGVGRFDVFMEKIKKKK
jgi:imidazoleglycerol phosphate synthase glutamine amidotransferase subunit HisH